MVDFNKAPYYDDFDENKKFLQILFQPGRPVQARELTQLQSILQNQVERGGAHIFKQGSKVFENEVVGGNQGYDSETIQYIKLAPRDHNGNIINVSNFIGKSITAPEGLPVIIGKVLAGTSNTGGDPATIFVRWIDHGGDFATLPDDEYLQIWDPTSSAGVYYTANVSTTELDSTGHGSVFQTSDGVYFVNGRYVKTDAQTIIVGKYDANATYRIGFDIIDDFVSSTDDASLLDPASGFSNYTGSGADRYKVNLVLTTKGDGITISQLQASNTISTEIGDIIASNNFFEVARIVDGRLTRHVRTPLYAELENLLARKIYDQSGNFTVSGHLPLLSEKSVASEGGLDGSDEFLFGVEGGKSYVYGFEWNNEGKTTWTAVPKARETITSPDNHRVPIIYTNYITLHDSINSISSITNSQTNDLPAKGIFSVNDQPIVSLFSQNRFITDNNLGANNTDLTARDGTGLLSANVYNSILVGTARAEAFQYDAAATKAANADFKIQGRSHRLYLRDFAPNKIHGTSNGINRSEVTELFYDNTSNVSYYKLETGFLKVHGFGNTGVDGTTNNMYGADFVNIQGFTNPSENWNIITGEVVDANNEWIGVKSTRAGTVDNYGADTALYGNVGIITRTTRGGISPRRLVLLDENSRALWSDAYNGASITINGETRKIIDYVGGAHVNSITTFQGSEDGGLELSSGQSLEGVGKRGLALVDREFSAAPDRSTQYTINFALKNARSVGINANTEANGHATADLAYWQSRGIADGTPGVYDIQSRGASPEFTTLYNIDVLSGVSPAGSIQDDNNTNEIYGARRVSGDALMGGSLGTLLGATGRGAVQTLKAHGSGTSLSSNTFFTAQRVYEGITSVTPGSAKTITLTTALWNDGQRFFRYNAGTTKEYSSDERRLFIHAVDPTGRVVDFDAGSSGDVTINDDGTHNGHDLVITIPSAYGYTAGTYDFIVTVIHEYVSPRTKTLRKANTAGVAPSVASGGFNLSNGQVLIQNSSGNNSLGEISMGQTDGKNPPSLVPQTLGVTDVLVQSVKILDTGLLTTDPTDEMVQQLALSNATFFDTHATANIATGSFIVDSGQRNHIYDHASLKLRPGKSLPLGQCLVLFDRFEHELSDVRKDAGTPSYFSVDSYQHTEDLTYTIESGAFVAGDIITGNVSGVRAKVFDVPAAATKLRAVNLTSLGPNTHFVANEAIFANTMGSGVVSVSGRAFVSAVKELEITYKNIPKFKGTSRTYNLRDCIDYRPRREDGDFKANYTVNSVAIPLDCSAFDLGDAFDLMPRYKLKSYAGRVDRVLLKKSREIKIQHGVPGLSPVPPVIEPDDGANPSMVLFNVFIPPYTFNIMPEDENAKGGVVVKSVKNRRYTMKEISRLDDRVRNLEYYVALNALEQNAKDQDVRDSQGLTRFKNGILTDNFNTHSTVRRQVNETLELAQGFNDYVGYLQPHYAIDKNMGHLWPAEAIDTADWKFELDRALSPGTTTSGNQDEVISLDYDVIPWNTADAPLQLMASESRETTQPAEGPPILDPNGEGTGKVNINPFSQYNFQGNLGLTPNFNDFIDIVDHGNVVVTNLTGQVDPLEGLPIDAIQTAQQNDGQATFPIPSQVTTSETHGPVQADPGTVSGNPAVITADSELTMDLTMAGISQGYSDRGDHWHVAAFDTPSSQDFTIELGAVMQQAWATMLHTPQTTLQVFEDAIVDITVATHMTPQDIGVSGTALKPFTSLHGWFAGEPVDNYISAASVVHLAGENNLGRRSGSRSGQGRIQEWVHIKDQTHEIAKALLVGGRRSVAYLTNITYGSASPGSNFSDSGIILVGNTTGQEVTTLQTDIGASQRIILDEDGYFGADLTSTPSHDHRSGYFQPGHSSSGGLVDYTSVKLAVDAPSYSNALAMPTLAEGAYSKNADGAYSGDTDWAGSPMTGTQITIVRGYGQGLSGTIISYDGGNKTANVLGFGTDFNPDGAIGSGTRSYYSLADTDSLRGANGLDSDRIRTNEHGEFYGTFHLPGGQFRTGTKILSLNDRGDNNPFLIKTWARAPYFSSGSIHTLSDSVVATRDIIDTEHAEGVSYTVTPAAEGAFNLWATRQSDGVRGKVYVTTGVTVERTGTNYICSTGTSTNHMRGVEIDGARQRPDGSFEYTPTPVLSRNGNDPPTYGTWADAYTAQAVSYDDAIVQQFRDNQSGQIHTFKSDGSRNSDMGGAKKDRWTPNNDRDYFPSLYPISGGSDRYAAGLEAGSAGSTVGGVRCFATVQNGTITKVTISDHGAAVFNEDAGEVATGAIWKAGWHTEYPQSTHGFKGVTVLSNKAEDIIDNLPYVRSQMEAIENGTALSNYGSSGCGSAADPLAQSFTVPGQTPDEPNRHGVFLCGIDLWFAEKGTNDVDVEIRELINGYPGQVAIMCMGGHSPARAIIPNEDIKVRNGTNVETFAGSGDAGLPDADDPESYSTAFFPAPVYLVPGRDYCFVVRCAASVDFFLWSSDSRGNILGSFDTGATTRAADVNVDHAKGSSHYGGSLFLSQNAKTWEPDQYKDLMFRFRIADFKYASGTAIFKAGTERLVHPLGTPLNPKPEAVMTPLAEDHRIDYFSAQTEERVPIGHNDQEGTVTYERNIMDQNGDRGGYVPHTPGELTYLASSAKLESGQADGQGSFWLKATITANVGGGAFTDRRVSPIIDMSKFKLTTWKNYINDGGITEKDVVFASGVGSGFAEGDLFTLTPADADTHLTDDIGQMQVADVIATGITAMNVYPTGTATAGRRYHQTPTLTKASGSGVLEHPTTDVIVIGETGTKGGNCNFRYVTKPVKLKSGMDASDISVTMDVNKPLGSQIYVYYKIKHKDDPGAFDDKNWVLMTQASPKDNRPTVAINTWMSGQIPMMEHTYSTGSEDEISYTDNNGDQFIGFKFFAIKIVGVTDTFAQPPIVGNLRAIAVT